MMMAAVATALTAATPTTATPTSSSNRSSDYTRVPLHVAQRVSTCQNGTTASGVSVCVE